MAQPDLHAALADHGMGRQAALPKIRPSLAASHLAHRGDYGSTLARASRASRHWPPCTRNSSHWPSLRNLAYRSSLISCGVSFAYLRGCNSHQH